MKKLYCPKCKSLVAKYSERATLVIDVACKYCDRLVVYNPVEDTVKMMKIPPRATSSGMRFY